MALGWRGSYLRYREFFLNVLSLYKKRADIRAFFEIILSISTVAIFLTFALKPTAITIINLIQEIKEKRSTVTALNQKLQNLNTAVSVFTQNQNLIPDIDTSVSTFPDPDVFAKQVLGIAVKNSVSILGLSVGQTVLIGPDTSKKATDVAPMPDSAKEMPITISAKGEYQNLSSFAKDFENLRVITKVDSLTINSSQTEGGQVIVLVVSGRVPFLKN